MSLRAVLYEMGLPCLVSALHPVPDVRLIQQNPFRVVLPEVNEDPLIYSGEHDG
jgi:hypothetical protein